MFRPYRATMLCAYCGALLFRKVSNIFDFIIKLSPVGALPYLKNPLRINFKPRGGDTPFKIIIFQIKARRCAITIILSITIFNSAPAGRNPSNNRHHELSPSPGGAAPKSSNRYSGLNSISYILKNSKYSSLNDCFRWCSS